MSTQIGSLGTPLPNLSVNVIIEWPLRYSQVLKKYWTNLAWELYNTVLIKYNDWMMKGIEAQFIAPQWLDVEKKP